MEHGEIVEITWPRATTLGVVNEFRGDLVEVILDDGEKILVPLEYVEIHDSVDDSESGPMLIGLLASALSGAFVASLIWWIVWI